MAKCPECGSEMTNWMNTIYGAVMDQIRLCRNEKRMNCRYKEHRKMPNRIRDRIKRRWRTKIVKEY